MWWMPCPGRRAAIKPGRYISQEKKKSLKSIGVLSEGVVSMYPIRVSRARRYMASSCIGDRAWSQWMDSCISDSSTYVTCTERGIVRRGAS